MVPLERLPRAIARPNHCALTNGHEGRIHGFVTDRGGSANVAAPSDPYVRCDAGMRADHGAVTGFSILADGEARGTTVAGIGPASSF